MKKWGGALLLTAIMISSWQMAAFLYNQPFLLPSPVQVVKRMIELNELLVTVHLLATLKVIIVGLIISIIFGWLTAIVMVLSETLERAFFPVLITSQTIPIIALAPIFVLWFGYSLTSKVVVTVLITFFPITVSTFDGLRSTNKEMTDLIKTMGANKWQVLLKIQIPHAMPYFFSGLKVGVTLSVIGAAIGEWLGAEAGLGYFSRRMMTQFDGAGVFAPIVWLSLIGILLVIFVKIIEHYFLNWRNIK